MSNTFFQGGEHFSGGQSPLATGLGITDYRFDKND